MSECVQFFFSHSLPCLFRTDHSIWIILLGHHKGCQVPHATESVIMDRHPVLTGSLNQQILKPLRKRSQKHVSSLQPRLLEPCLVELQAANPGPRPRNLSDRGDDVNLGQLDINPAQPPHFVPQFLGPPWPCATESDGVAGLRLELHLLAPKPSRGSRFRQFVFQDGELNMVSPITRWWMLHFNALVH